MLVNVQSMDINRYSHMIIWKDDGSMLGNFMPDNKNVDIDSTKFETKYMYVHICVCMYVHMYAFIYTCIV